MDRDIIIWVESVKTPIGVLFLLVRSLWSKSTIFYNKYSVSNLALKTILFFNRFKKCFWEANLSYDGLPSSASYEIRNDALHVVNTYIQGTGFSAKRTKNVLRAVLLNVMISKMLFFRLVEKRISELQFEDRQHLIIFERLPIKIFIVNTAINVNFTFAYTKIDFFSIRMLVSSLLLFLYDRLYVIIGAFLKCSGPSHQEGKAAIWMEYTDLLLNNNRFLFFWLDSAKRKAYKIVCYFDRLDTPITKDRTAELLGRGLDFIDCSNLHAIGQLSIRDYILFLRTEMRNLDSKNLWLQFFFFKLFFFEQLYERIYRRYNVKMLVQHQETSWLQECQKKAISSAGGIMVGFHWSNYPYYDMFTHLHVSHVFFVWGRAIADYLAAKGHSCEHILPSGLWFRPDQDHDIEQQVAVLNKRVPFVLGIFDSSFRYNSYQSPAALIAFYRMILRIIKSTGFGCIIKSKFDGLRDLCNYPDGDSIASDVEMLVNAGQLIILDYRLSPLTVSVNANLSVCFGINSAGIIAGAYGCKAIHWDVEYLSRHPIYTDTEQRVFYRDLHSLEDAIMMSYHGDQQIGDFSKWQRDFNHYCDKAASERVAQFIDSFMNGVSNGENSQKVLMECITSYKTNNTIKDNWGCSQNWWTGDISHNQFYENKG